MDLPVVCSVVSSVLDPFPVCWRYDTLDLDTSVVSYESVRAISYLSFLEEASVVYIVHCLLGVECSCEWFKFRTSLHKCIRV